MLKTTPPTGTRPVVLYDGLCRFCTASARSLERLVGKKRIELRSFQDPGVLDAFPGVSHEACMKAMHLVTPDGSVYAAAEAAARAFMQVPLVGWLAYAYYVPGLRWASEAVYRLIARNRYRIAGKNVTCDGGTCHLHVDG